MTKLSTEEIDAAAIAAVRAQDLSDEVARELAELSNHLLFTKEARVKSVERTLNELQKCHTIRCVVSKGEDRKLEHDEVVKCQNIWKNIFLEKELTDRQRHQFRLRYKDDGTCNAVLRERVGNPKLANAIYTHGLPWIMQSGAAGWVSGDDVLHRSLSEGVLWLKNVGQGLVERKKRVLYAEAQHLGGKRKNESSLEATRQRGRATIATEHVVMLPPTQFSIIK